MRIHRLLLALAVGSAMGALWAAPASAATSFTCVASDSNTCVVTIPLTTNMDEQVTSTMPDTQPWFDSEYGGNCPGGAGPYTITDSSWDGGTTGHVWTAELTTGDTEGAGCEAQITFQHVTSGPPAPHPYKSVSITGPTSVAHNGSATFTSVIKPKPPAGHAVLQRKNGTRWVNLGTLHFVAAHNRWQVTVKWTAPVHAIWTLRVLATSATGLAVTPSGSIRVHTT